MLLSFPILVVEGFFFTDKKKRNGGVEDFHSFMSTYLYILPIATAWDQFYSHFPLLAAEQLHSGKAEIWGQWPGDEPLCLTFRPLLFHAW